jgi:aromatic ring hydroxylase
MITAEEYKKSLRELNLKVYMFCRRLEKVVDDPLSRAFMDMVVKTYEFVHRP